MWANNKALKLHQRIGPLGAAACASRRALPRWRAGVKGKARRLAPENRHRRAGGHCATPPSVNRPNRPVPCPPLQHRALSTSPTPPTLGVMIITHAVNVHGQSRVYLGGTGSLFAWIEPLPDSPRWVFRFKEGLCANPLLDQDMRSWATHLLLKLADLLNVAPADLANVPYEAIASLHNDSPLEHARMPTPRKRTLGTAYMATSPGITRPSGDFHPGDYSNRNRRR